ncbi:MAG: alkaline phosphatase family protein [Terriglobia bacterium]
MNRVLAHPRASLLVPLLLAGLGLARAEAPAAAGPPPPRPRLIQLKVDGLSPLLLDVLMNPDDPEKLARLPEPEAFHRAIQLFCLETGREDLVPNLRRFFYDQGVRAENMFSATTTLSSIAWGVIDTGQPSVVKRHMTFNRANGFLRVHLDGFRDTWEFATRRGRKTNALWELDQAGVSLFSDAFQPLRRYEVPQIYYRLTPRDYLVGLGKVYLTAGGDPAKPWTILRGYLARQAGGIDYVDFWEDFGADLLAAKILELDFSGQERYDYISGFFTLDHQQHVDPNPENVVQRLMRLDRRIGRVLTAVERSQRRDQTLVVLVSDHGSEYQPGAINLAFPITRIFRQRLFGGHTVITAMLEEAGRAISNPFPWLIFPHVYESPSSPYRKAAGPGGKDGYPTAFFDNFGNARAEAHLRNNDLNRLHLLLLARHRTLDEEGRARWRELLRATLADTWAWLETELADYQAYFEGVQAWVPNLAKRADPYWSDAAARLQAEQERDKHPLRALKRLAELCQAERPALWLQEHELPVPRLIPKKYFGPRNSLYQLTHYTIGLDENLEWIETTVDTRGHRLPMDYISLLSHYRVPNPPLSHEPNPVDLIVRSLPVEAVQRALVERGWLDPATELRQVIWIVSTAQTNLRRGGQALLLEDTDSRLRYLPLRNLVEDAEGHFDFELPNELDPLGLFYDPGFRSETGEPAFLWLKRFHDRRAWLRAVGNTAYTNAPLVFSDITGLHTPAFIDNPEFQAALTGFPSEAAKQLYLRGLHWKYASQQPDLLLWSSLLWNFSSKSQTSGGSHGGLGPRVARTTFLLWGGRDYGLPPGLRIEEPATTLDIAPTLAQLMGMLDRDGRIIRQTGAVRERPFLPFPGQALLPAEIALAHSHAGETLATPPTTGTGNDD